MKRGRALEELQGRDPRSVAELLVPGMRGRPADDPLRAQLAEVAPAVLFEAVKAAKAAALPQHRRAVRGCLLCAGEMTVESMKPVADRFFALANKRRRQPVRKRPTLSRAQQHMLLTTYFVFDESGQHETRTVCVMHLFRVFSVTEANLRTMMRDREEVMQYRPPEEEEAMLRMDPIVARPLRARRGRDPDEAVN
jgi:hypothetical protein